MGNETNSLKKIWSINNRTKYFVYVLIGLSVVSVTLFALLIIGKNSLNKKEAALAKEKVNYFENINLKAKGVIVFDIINEREIFSKNGEVPLPLASLTKILTAIITSEKLDDNQKIKITDEYLTPEGDSKLIVGDTWQVADLRDFTLLTSSNDGAFALATISEIKNNQNQNNIQISGDDLRIQFIKNMNDTAKKIGLSNSKFFNEHGLDKDIDKGGAYGSAYDMALLFKYALENHPEILEATRYKNLEFTSAEGSYFANNTNIFVDKIPNLIASKTGFTDLAGGNLVIAFNADINRPIIISVLGSTEEGRFTDVLQLIEATIKQLSIL
ncbi:MAG: Serine-type D-Ala-D-Ala carboxypeptidase [Parcubacteria group bacterium GW2011_GWB1_35_5]|uniref:Peptidase S11 D-alanyl-D-alanine carboxypeptidase A N-terminal domain-containing protein n=1 Tax=Candidatus Zambryskibacteria bacterium RIFCSPLOWO2_01_FULL_35_19 TaxID=1802757 RepID=A0A1G2TXT0_9BACT|nr:MAG: Serine-type D-Ala-D-Ala carboxypeptidase [Parcubacteria group bacterium GW2011_GWC1_34_10]KKP80931.1 MAG: Serine-type D-Ala-D-Ala carboxypeptidase [Parcubacteria group bacterium GW2011_GWB1_35_5]OHA86391.1 MAG: hypothetical protein A2726_02645 [Candidatus Zambryskibacteria bacterium RIFCSPHIGHO2_01_FULL_35_32]OHB01983.1 MAG: hypothetical protein A3A90_01965 [Candidatus Zambryskibacteria bacterium RIFCSPLOWO2_01_FULL_35_19]